MLDKTFSLIVLTSIINLVIVMTVIRLSFIAGLVMLLVLPVMAGILIAMRSTDIDGES